LSGPKRSSFFLRQKTPPFMLLKSGHPINAGKCQ
jgi:hypothetical protein